MADHTIRVLCVDDHCIVRDGLASLLNHEPDIEVVALAATGEEAVELYRRRHPDITLMDLRLRAMSGIKAIEAIRHENPRARIIVLTMYDGDEDIYRALRAGAITYLLKDTVPDDLIRIVREVHGGKKPKQTDIEARLAERATHPTLTAREVEVTELLSKGLRVKEIAATLGISEGTVQAHTKNIFLKLGVNDRIAAVQVAQRRGIVHAA